MTDFKGILEVIDGMDDATKLIYLTEVIIDAKGVIDNCESIRADLAQMMYDRGEVELGDGRYIKMTQRRTKKVDVEQLKMSDNNLYMRLAEDGLLTVPSSVVKEVPEVGEFTEENISKSYKVEGL